MIRNLVKLTIKNNGHDHHVAYCPFPLVIWMWNVLIGSHVSTVSLQMVTLFWERGEIFRRWSSTGASELLRLGLEAFLPFPFLVTICFLCTDVMWSTSSFFCHYAFSAWCYDGLYPSGTISQKSILSPLSCFCQNILFLTGKVIKTKVGIGKWGCCSDKPDHMAHRA